MAGAGWGEEVDPEVHGCQGRALERVILEEEGNGEEGEQNDHAMSHRD